MCTENEGTGLARLAMAGGSITCWQSVSIRFCSRLNWLISEVLGMRIGQGRLSGIFKDNINMDLRYTLSGNGKIIN
jgi:hypothetical protein